MRRLSVRNRHAGTRVNVHLLRRIIRSLLERHLDEAGYELGIHLVDEEEMTSLNESFLRHAGSTDVITFNYREPDCDGSGLIGDIFICLDEAAIQARRFQTCWQSELVRYVIHGTLHLEGYDDQNGDERRRMKREESRLLRELGKDFAFRELAGRVRKDE